MTRSDQANSKESSAFAGCMTVSDRGAWKIFACLFAVAFRPMRDSCLSTSRIESSCPLGNPGRTLNHGLLLPPKTARTWSLFLHPLHAKAKWWTLLAYCACLSRRSGGLLALPFRCCSNDQHWLEQARRAQHESEENYGLPPAARTKMMTRTTPTPRTTARSSTPACCSNSTNNLTTKAA